MPGNSDSNGNMIWLDKPLSSSALPEQTVITSDESITGLYACNIQTDIINVSIKVQIVNDVFLHVQLSEITSIDLIGINVIINTADEIPITLSFVDIQESQNAVLLIEDALEGAYINCNEVVQDLNLSFIDIRTGAPFISFTYPALIFADNTILGKVNSQSEAIALLVQYGQNHYIVNADITPDSFIISYTKQYENFVPLTISAINSYFTCQVNSQNISFTINYLLQDKFWVVYDNKTVIGNSLQTINFINPSNNSFDLFYTNDYLDLLDLSNIGLISILNTLPVFLQNLVINKSQLTNISFLSSLQNLKTLTISQTPITTIDFSNNFLLQQINLLNCSLNTITGENSLLGLNSFKAVNLFITITPTFTSSSDLKLLEFTGCNFITTLGSISSNTKLLSYIVNGSQLSVTSIDLTHLINIRTLNISNSLLSTFPSLIANINLSYIDVSYNDFLDATVESIVANIVAHANTRGGYLNLSNQLSNIDFSTLGDTFTNNVDYLRSILQWTVILE